MCWDCSLVNEEQHIYVEKSENVHGLFGHAKHAMFREAGEAPCTYVKITPAHLRPDPYAEMIHGSCFGTSSVFDDERHWQ